MAKENKSRRFIKGVGFNAVGSAMNIILNLISLIIAVKLISKEQFGVFTLLSVIVYFFTAISDFGMENTIVHYVAARMEKQKKIIATALNARLLISLIVILLILLLKGPVSNIFHSEILADFMMFAAFMFFAQYILIILQGFLIGLHLYRRSAIVQAAGGAVRLLLIILFVWLLKWQITGLLFAVILASLISCVLAYLLLPWVIIPKTDPDILREILRFGLPLQVNKIFGVIYDRAGVLMLGMMKNPLSVAAYEIGFKIPESLSTIFNTFRQVYFSHMSEFYGNDKTESARKLFITSLRLISFFTAFAALIAGLFHRGIITVLFSEQYAESGMVLSVLMIALIVGMCNHLMGNTLIASGKPKKILFPSAAQSVLTIVLNLAFIPLFGALGVAYASLISLSVVNVIFLMLCEKGFRLMTGWSYLRSLIALAVSLSVFYFAGADNTGVKPLIILAFCAISLSLKAVGKEDVLLLYNTIRTAKKEGEAQ